MVRVESENLKGIHYETGKHIEVILEDGRIKDVREISDTEDAEYLIAPGLVDLQINGYVGIDFNKNYLTSPEWETVIQKLTQVGVTTFYPTIITNSFEQLSSIFEGNGNYISKGSFEEWIAGFHLEGPYLSTSDGPRGAHAKNFVRKPNWDEFCALQEKADGKIKIITLSPEWEEAVDFIERATKSGVKVAIGHTAANSQQIHAAVKAGAVLSTHLGNGAHISLPRHPNYLWDQLAEQQLWASVISDGNHLDENVLRVIQKVKQEKMILISDSVALAGMKPGDYTTPVGGDVTLTESGRLHLKSHPDLLAGSAQCLFDGVKNLVDKRISKFDEAIKMASIYPSKLMDLPQSKGISAGAPADLILVNKSRFDWEIIKTYKNGKLIFNKERE